MSKLDDLIQKYCPNGVEYKEVKDVCNISKGVQFNKRDMNKIGTFPVINGGILPSGYIERYNQEKNTITISQGGASAGYVNWQNQKFWAGAHCYSVKALSNIVDRYLYHFLKMKEYILQRRQYGAGIPSLSKSIIENLLIPVPPLSVQEEIAHILDSFTKLTEELTEELTERKKQYEYYHNELLNFDDNISIKKLFEVAEVYDSLHQTPKYSQDKYSMIRVQDIKKGYINIDSTMKVSKDIFDKFTKKYKPQKNDIVVSRVGSYGNFAIIPNDCCCLGQNIAIIHPNINSKYIYYVLTSNKIKYWINKMVKGASHKSFSLADIKKIPIPIPHIEEQKRIVTILDKFDTLCNDLSIGLPAEIEARKKQYEYYRDKLLTFKELKQ